jgi:hypothetical protein
MTIVLPSSMPLFLLATLVQLMLKAPTAATMSNKDTSVRRWKLL